MPPSERVQDVIRRSKRESVGGVLQFPSDLGAHSTLMIFSKYKYVPPGERSLNKVNASTYSSQFISKRDAILLPLPSNIEDTYSVRVQGYDAEISGEAVSRAASAFAGAGDLSLGNLASSLSASIPDVDWSSLISGNTSDISKSVAFLGRRTAETILPGAARSISAGIGNAINPKASLYFDGVTLKQPNFRWTLAPTTEAESDIIRNMSELIKRNVLPSYGTAIGLTRSLLNYPNMVDIFFLGIDQSYFVHYKTCMVSQFSLNFTPNGLAIVKGGRPAMVTMDMTLIEADIHTSEDYGGEGTTNISIGANTPPGDPTSRGGPQ